MYLFIATLLCTLPLFSLKNYILRNDKFSLEFVLNIQQFKSDQGVLNHHHSHWKIKKKKYFFYKLQTYNLGQCLWSVISNHLTQCGVLFQCVLFLRVLGVPINKNSNKKSICLKNVKFYCTSSTRINSCWRLSRSISTLRRSSSSSFFQKLSRSLTLISLAGITRE